MKKIIGIFLLSMLIVFSSCDEIIPISTFNSSFPKKNKNLADILGTEIKLKTSNDTIDLKIISTKNINIIIDKDNNDTLFMGKVSLYKGIYYFSQQLNDTSFWIYSVKINDNLITGLNTCWSQIIDVDNEIISGKYKNIVRYKSPDTTIIRLRAEMQTLHKLFSSIINDYTPDTIINFKKSTKIQSEIKKQEINTDYEEYVLISKVYPNPTNGIFTIELQNNNGLEYEIYNLNGSCIMKGKFLEIKNQIDISSNKNGIYILKIKNSEINHTETLKIIKNN
ncbi:MAG: hypothetical protein BWY22_01295 [Bacteroidetes bacterium ADurb.Bin217]|nr:MAG: hypothetical protein BWY22_01295 [Bacteroidetes bacterium ADurb.Bin217]